MPQTGSNDSLRIPDLHRGLESNACQTCHAAPARAELSGAEMYTRVWVRCHGLHGETSLSDGFILQDYVRTAEDEGLANGIRDGAQGMPSFHALLTSDNINDLLAFMRSW